MRYILPEVIMRGRSNGAPLPTWKAAAIVFHSRSRSRPTVDRLGGSPMSYRLFAGLEPDEVYTTTCQGQDVGILCNVGGKMGGGPLAAALVEELSALGVRWIVGVGCAGSIDPAAPRGSQFAIASAPITDGTSRSYLAAGAPAATPDLGMLRLAASLGARYGGIAQVTAATVDALYRETPQAVAEWRATGAQVIDMEAAPFYAAAAVCDVRAVYVGHVSDELRETEWKSWFGEDRAAMTATTAEIAGALLEETLRSSAAGGPGL